MTPKTIPQMRNSYRIVFAIAAYPFWITAPLAAQQVIVKPYVQPGDAGSSRTGEELVICWLTDQTPGDFGVEYGLADGPMQAASPERVALDFAPAEAGRTGSTPPEREQHYFRYAARLTGLPLDARVRYRVKLGEATIREATTRTRATPGRPVRMVLVGDMASGKEPQREIACQISEEKPDLLVALGDLVYPDGRVSQYMKSFWLTYNEASPADPKAGAALMASVPFYAVIGNHDAAARFPAVPDALGAYYFFTRPEMDRAKVHGTRRSARPDRRQTGFGPRRLTVTRTWMFTRLKTGRPTSWC